MAGREVKDFTNLSDPKDKKWGSKGGKDKADDEDLAFKRMVAKMQEVAGERGGYLHGRGALDSDDLLYLKEQMEAEEDAERLRRRTEKRAFAAFKKAASLVDSASISTLPAIRVEPKPRSGIRQQVLVKSIVKVKADRPRSSEPPSTLESTKLSTSSQESIPETQSAAAAPPAKAAAHQGGLLGLAYESEDDSDGEEEPQEVPAAKRLKDETRDK
jgi:hypothetical protein